MKFTIVFLLAFLVGCSSNNEYKTEILGAWEVYNLNGKTDLYKAFVGTTMTFNSDGSFSRGSASKTYLSGTYDIAGETIKLKWNKKDHSSIISIKDTNLSFEKDMSFSSGDIPMKSIYKKK